MYHKKALTSMSITIDKEYCYQHGDDESNRNELENNLRLEFAGSCGGGDNGGDRDSGRDKKDRVALRTVSNGIGGHHCDFILFSWLEAKLLQGLSYLGWNSVNFLRHSGHHSCWISSKGEDHTSILRQIAKQLPLPSQKALLVNDLSVQALTQWLFQEKHNVDILPHT